MDHSGMDHSGMDHSSMSMSMAMGTFHWSSTGDALWFDAWMPKTESAYIGACFGLFFFAILSRALVAIEIYYVSWTRKRFERIHGLSDDFSSNPEEQSASSNRTNDILETGQKSMSSVFHSKNYPKPLALPRVPPFSWSVDTVRSFLTALTTFISYLLMLVVMTGNGGFFIVIIVGVFVGEMLFGRFRALDALRSDHGH
ncbi:Ctr copper transporter [Dichotomocladium elegans]|nr:Ctr copper transporter [Dichotomocladium elegans]